jgi:hypothetical protein
MRTHRAGFEALAGRDELAVGREHGPALGTSGSGFTAEERVSVEPQAHEIIPRGTSVLLRGTGTSAGRLANSPAPATSVRRSCRASGREKRACPGAPRSTPRRAASQTAIAFGASVMATRNLVMNTAAATVPWFSGVTTTQSDSISRRANVWFALWFVVFVSGCGRRDAAAEQQVAASASRSVDGA